MLALRQSDWRNCGLCVGLYAMLRHWWEYGDEKTGINWLNEKRSLIPWGLRVPSVLRLSGKHIFPVCTRNISEILQRPVEVSNQTILTIRNESRSNYPMNQSGPPTRACQIDEHGRRQPGSRQKSSRYRSAAIVVLAIFLVQLVERNQGVINFIQLILIDFSSFFFLFHQPDFAYAWYRLTAVGFAVSSDKINFA